VPAVRGPAGRVVRAIFGGYREAYRDRRAGLPYQQMAVCRRCLAVVPVAEMDANRRCPNCQGIKTTPAPAPAPDVDADHAAANTENTRRDRLTAAGAVFDAMVGGSGRIGSGCRAKCAISRWVMFGPIRSHACSSCGDLTGDDGQGNRVHIGTRKAECSNQEGVFSASPRTALLLPESEVGECDIHPERLGEFSGGGMRMCKECAEAYEGGQSVASPAVNGAGAENNGGNGVAALHIGEGFGPDGRPTPVEFPASNGGTKIEEMSPALAAAIRGEMQDKARRENPAPNGGNGMAGMARSAPREVSVPGMGDAGTDISSSHHAYNGTAGLAAALVYEFDNMAANLAASNADRDLIDGCHELMEMAGVMSAKSSSLAQLIADRHVPVADAHAAAGGADHVADAPWYEG
jgi:hypothetical protein